MFGKKWRTYYTHYTADTPDGEVASVEPAPVVSNHDLSGRKIAKVIAKDIRQTEGIDCRREDVQIHSVTVRKGRHDVELAGKKRGFRLW